MKLHEITNVSVPLNETTLQLLKSGTDGQFSSRNDINNVRITQKEYTKFGDSELMVKAKCAGETNNYNCEILFQGVEFSQPGDPQAITINNLQILPLSLNLNVKVNCTCQDFKWTFAWQNSDAGALLGNPPPPYSRTTDRPPRNQTNTPGLCKHLNRLVDDMQSEMLFL
jgi:hypothetical protein